MFFVTRPSGVQDRYLRVQESTEKEDFQEKDDQEQKEKKENRFKKIEKGSEVFADEIMTASVVTLPEDATLEEAWETIRKRKISQFPVVTKDGRMVGLLTDHDIMVAIKMLTPEEVKKQDKSLVKDVMKKHIICASPKTEMQSIAKVFFDEGIGVMPILDEASHIMGIVTTRDVLKTISKVSSFRSILGGK